MTEQDKQALIKHFCSRDCGEAAEGCTIMPCHEIELIQEFPTTEALPPANCSEIPNNSDTISRKAVITAIDNCGCDGEDSCGQTWIYKENAVETIEMVEPLPPAQPERIKGHWIESDAQNRLMKNFIAKGETWRVCDKCGAGFMIGYKHESDKIYHETFHNFCPKCGADMREVTE